MRALVCNAPGQLVMTPRPAPQPRGNEALVRIKRVGICGTDMHIFKGDQPFVEYPRVMGHELAGEIVSVGNDSSLKAGDRACLVPYLACGACIACRRSKPNCCMHIAVLGVHRDGGLAEYVCVPTETVLPANDLSLDALALTEFLAIGRHAVRRAAVSPGQRVLVVGSGPIGIGVALFALEQGADVTTVDARPDRRDFCRNVLSVRSTFTPGASLDAELREMTDGEYFDVVFDATGSRGAMEAGFHYVAHGGTYVLVSIVQGDIAFTDSEFHKREATLLASRNATREDFLDVLAAMRAGRIPLEDLTTHRATLEDLPQMLPQWCAPDSGVIKALVEI